MELESRVKKTVFWSRYARSGTVLFLCLGVQSRSSSDLAPLDLLAAPLEKQMQSLAFYGGICQLLPRLLTNFQLESVLRATAPSFGIIFFKKFQSDAK